MLQSSECRKSSAPRFCAEALESRVLLAVSLVRDINTNPVTTDASVLGKLGNVALLSVTQGTTGLEAGEDFPSQRPTLYRTDGTVKGTFGLGGGFEPALVASGNTFALFRTSGGLWRTDGTVKGTFKLNDIRKVVRGAVLGNNILFIGNDGSNGYALWKTDGTVNGTVRLTKNLGREAFDSEIISFGGNVYFQAVAGDHGAELCRSDGTTTGTILFADLAKGSTPSRPRNFVATSDRLYFTDNIDGSSKQHLWNTDGTSVTLVNTATRNGITGLRAIGDTLYFIEDEVTSIVGADSVWRTRAAPGTVKRLRQLFQPTLIELDPDGAPTDRLYLVDGGVAGAPSRSIYVVRGDAVSSIQSDTSTFPFVTFRQTGNDLYFTKHFSDTTGVSLEDFWHADGTANGATLVKEFTGEVQVSAVKSAGGSTFFAVNSNLPLQSPELWTTDGTGAIKLATLASSGDVNFDVSTTVAIGNTLYFADTQSPGTVFKTDGTADGTGSIENLYANTDSSYPTDLVNGVGGLYFNTTNTIYVRHDDGELEQLTLSGQIVGKLGTHEILVAGKSILKTDGTLNGTSTIFTSSAFIGHAAIAGGSIYFENAGDLWKSDGTSKGTVKLKAGLKMIRSISLGTMLAFVTENGSEQQLWRTDGTSKGTILLGHNISPQSQLGGFKRSVFFFVLNGKDNALWRTDGTVDGTHKVKSGFQAVNVPFEFVLAGNTFYFGASETIWKTDGTGDGTIPLKPAIQTGKLEFGGFLGAAGIGDRVYFAMYDPTHGTSLWTSTGTPQKTVLLKAVDPTSNFYDESDHQTVAVEPGAAAGSNFYFSVNQGNGNQQLWKTDGSPSGTVAISNAPGDDGLSPRDFVVRNNTLFFGGEDPVHNRELWQLPLL